MKKFKLPKFADKQELHKFLVDNEDLIIAQKRSAIKESEGFSSSPMLVYKGVGSANQKSEEELLAQPILETRVAINTTNVFDSHKDLHLPSMWDKSLSENKMGMHLQEHSRTFKNIISSGNDLNVYVETKTWKQLGYDMEGKTQVLMHDSNIRKSRNEYMHEQYAKGYVTNHSVGMQYVKLVTCINDEDYPVQKENWDKYFPMGANKSEAEAWGYFWAVLEAKYIEGSAVAAGSNRFTPTVEVKNKAAIDQAIKEQAIKAWLLK